MDEQNAEKSISEQVADGSLKLSPTQKIVIDASGEERIVEKSLSELVAEGQVAIAPTQKVVGNGPEARIVEHTPAELLAAGLKTPGELLAENLLSREDVKERAILRLREETAVWFRSHKTPNGYRLDDLARQKANFSFPFRSLPETDTTKKELLETGMIYPDAILDELLAEVRKVQDAYSAAKGAIVAGYEEEKPVEVWESVSLEDYL